MAKTYDYYKDLPPYAKAVVLIGTGVAVWVIYSRIRNSFLKKAEEKKSQQAVISAKDELSNLNSRGVRPTISRTQADGWADQIVKQFTGADLTLGSYDVVARIFSNLKNDADYLMLKTSFGTRTYPDALFGSVSNVTLEGAIQDELTNMRISDLNGILAKKGINYKI